MGFDLGSAVAGGLQTIGSWVGLKSQQDKQNQFTEDMWNKQNEYNSPVQQMARLKAAGLNPHLVYGQSAAGAAGNASSAPQKVAARPDTDFLGRYAQVQAVNNAKQQNALIASQERLNDARLNTEIFKQASIGATTDTSKYDLQYKKDTRSALIRIMENNAQASDYTPGTALARLSNMNSSTEVNNAKLPWMKAQEDVMASQKQKLDAEVVRFSHLNNLTDAQTAQVQQHTENLIQQLANLKTDGEIKIAVRDIKRYFSNLANSGINPNINSTIMGAGDIFNNALNQIEDKSAGIAKKAWEVVKKSLLHAGAAH